MFVKNEYPLLSQMPSGRTLIYRLGVNGGCSFFVNMGQYFLGRGLKRGDDEAVGAVDDRGVEAGEVDSGGCLAVVAHAFADY